MFEPTVFAATTTTPAPVVTTAPALPPELADLVGEGKKYATSEAALASIPHAQKHILTLEEENKKIKEELAKRKTTEEILSELKQTGLPAGTTTPSVGLTQEQIAKIVAQEIDSRKSSEVAQSNVDKVTSVFTEKYGEKAEETFIKLAQDSGLSIKDMNKLAATSPNAVLKLAGIEQKTIQTVSKPVGTINTDTRKPNTEGEKSARVGKDGSTRNLVDRWKIAGEKIGKTA